MQPPAPALAFNNRYSGAPSRRRRSTALLLALLFTTALFWLLWFAYARAIEEEDSAQGLTLFAVPLTMGEEVERPEPVKVDQREVLADTEEEAAPETGPLTISPSPDLAPIPEPEFVLTPLILPEVPKPGDRLATTQGGNSDGKHTFGPEGLNGKGGEGVAGDGTGGAGNGKGRGSQLFASWAPSMNFVKLNYFYPKEARGAGIEGAALLKCMALKKDRVRDCSVVGEAPEGQDFGAAALAAEDILRVRVHNQVGRRVYNEWILIETVFKPSTKRRNAQNRMITGDAETISP